MLRSRWSIGFLILVVFTFRFGSAFLFGDQLLAANICDDGFYYFKIADNIAHGPGSTFDGIAQTNGYQPLWMAVLVPALRVFHPSTVHSQLVFFSLLNLSAFFVLALLLWHLLNLWFGGFLANIGILILSLSKFSTTFIGGTEAPLLAILLISLIIYFDKSFAAKGELARLDWRIGILGGLLILTRLDYIVVYGVMLLGAVYYDWKARRQLSAIRNRILPLVLPATILASAYLTSNLLFFGHLLPISGALKTVDFPAPSFASVWTLGDNWTLLLMAANLLFLAVLWVWRRLPGEPDRALQMLRIWALSNCAYLLFLFLSVRATGKWYFVSPILMSVAFGCWFLKKTQSQFGLNPARTAIAVSAILVVAALASNYGRVQYNRSSTCAYSAPFQFVSWCNEHLPDTAVIGIPDAGLFAFLSRHRVVNTDGLVNDWEYAQACRNGHALEVLKARGVDYLATAYGSHIWDDPPGVHHYNVATLQPGMPGNTSIFPDGGVMHQLKYEGDRMVLWSMRTPPPDSTAAAATVSTR